MERLFGLRDKLSVLREFTKSVKESYMSDECKSVLIEKIDECFELCNFLLRFAPKELVANYVEGCYEREAGHEFKKDAEPLEFTINLMRSDDYKERFKAEYYQTKIRYDKLHKMLIKAEAGTLDFKLNCSLELLTEQKRCMGMYLHALEVRAEIEGIEL